MTWILALLGLLLTIAGLWGGPVRSSRKRPDHELAAARQGGTADAWDILTRPIEDELIKIPEHQPWYMPGRDRRFQQGLALGLGAGLLVASLAVALVPRGALPQPAGQTPTTQKPAGNATGTPGAGTPAAGTPGAGTGTQQPATPTTPPPAAPPAAEPPRPANVLFTIPSGALAPGIAADLKAAGLIADEKAFLDRLEDRELDGLLKAGTFTVPTGASVDQVIDVLTR